MVPWTPCGPKLAYVLIVAVVKITAPAIVLVWAILTAPPIPTPPATVNAPVSVLVLTVVLPTDR